MGKQDVMRETERSSLDLFRQNYPRESSDGEPGSKLYFKRLRKTILKEFDETGYCELVDFFLEARNAVQIDIVTYSVFCDIVHNGAESDENGEQEKDDSNTYIPYIVSSNFWGERKKMRWEECRSKNNHLISFDENVRETIRRVRSLLRVRHYEIIQNRANAEAKTAEVKPVEVRESEQILERAGREAEAIRKEAQENLKAARNRAEQIIREAGREAEERLGYVKRQAEGMLRDTETEVERMKASAKEAAEISYADEMKRMKEESAEKASRLISQYLADDQKEYRQSILEEMEQFSADYLEDTKRALAIHDEMRDTTRELQVEWMTAFDNTVRQLNSMKEDFYGHLRNWQASLYPRDLQPLAEIYVELYRMLNADKFIRDIMIESGMSEEDAAACMKDPMSAPATSIGKLSRLNRNLTHLLARFGEVLQGFDLYPFYPKAGDVFDETWHVSDDDIDCAGKLISGYVAPGVAKRIEDELGDDVLVRAEVRIEMEK